MALHSSRPPLPCGWYLGGLAALVAGWGCLNQSPPPRAPFLLQQPLILLPLMVSRPLGNHCRSHIRQTTTMSSVCGWGTESPWGTQSQQHCLVRCLRCLLTLRSALWRLQQTVAYHELSPKLYLSFFTNLSPDGEGMVTILFCCDPVMDKAAVCQGHHGWQGGYRPYEVKETAAVVLPPGCEHETGPSKRPQKASSLWYQSWHRARQTRCQKENKRAASRPSGCQVIPTSLGEPGLPPWLRGKESSPVQETWVQPLGQDDPLEKEMATHSSIPPWETSWTESLVGYTPRGHKELDTTQRLNDRGAWTRGAMSRGDFRFQ